MMSSLSRRALGATALLAIASLPCSAPSTARQAKDPWSEARARISGSEYQFSLTRDGAWSAPNRAQGLRSTLTPTGLTLTPRVIPPPGWPGTLTLGLRRYGRARTMEEVGPAQRVAIGNRVELRRDELYLTEWYVNDARGLEQGFTLGRPPSSGGDEALVLELRIPPDLAAAVQNGGRDAVFTTRGGDPVVRYTGLAAFDAAGRSLPARLEAEGNRVLILVEDQGAIYPIVIDPLLTSAGWTAEGDLADAFFGFSVAGAGDIDGDGFADVIVGAPEFDGGLVDEGKVFVYRGTPGGLILHWTAEGDATGAQYGRSVASAGDVNGDGFDDIIVGAPFLESDPPGLPDETNEGMAFVYLGSVSGLAVPPSPAWTGQSNQAGALFGWSVAGAGDIDNNGTDEVIVGAPQFEMDPPGLPDETNEGRASVFLWSAGGMTLVPGWSAESNQAGAQMGYAVATAGDVNVGDFDDLIVGAPFYDTVPGNNHGAAFVWVGSPVGPPPPSGTPGNASWVASGGQVDSRFGWSVSSAGDVDNDGFDDVVVGAPLYDFPDASEGRISAYRGGAAGLGGLAAWTAESNQPGAQLGYSVASAGDVDADGHADIAAGAPFYDGRGRAFLWRGSAMGPPGLPAAPAGIPDNAHWSAQSDLPGAQYGISVGSAGDVNNDMLSDVIIGANLYDGPQADEGKAFVYLGFVPPQYLEFGPQPGSRRVEAVATAYTSLRGLVTGEYLISGGGAVTMGGCGPCTRTFTFSDLNAVKDPNDTASGGQPAFTVTAGSALVSTPLPQDPIVFPGAADLDLKLYSFLLDSFGASTEPGGVGGLGERHGLFWTLPGNLDGAAGSAFPLPPVPIEQDLDFTASVLVNPSFWIGPKDYPFRVHPEAASTLEIMRTRADLGRSELVYQVKEQGECAVSPGACLDEANDRIFALAVATGSLWDLNQFDGDPNTPAGSVGTPYVESGGLRATLHLDAGSDAQRTYRPLYPAGVDVTLDAGSAIQMTDTEPAGGSLDGSLTFTVRTGAMQADPNVDCTDLVNRSSQFAGGQLLATGRLSIGKLEDLPGDEWDELSWGGQGRGFYAADLDPNHLSFYAPGTVARLDAGSPDESVQIHLMSKLGGGFGEGTYAGVNITKDPSIASPPMTIGLDTVCPGPDPNTGHSFTTASTKTKLHARRAGVTGVADAGDIGSAPFPYMGYDLTLQQFGAGFLDNLPVESGVTADDLFIPQPSDVTFEFAFDSVVDLLECGDFGGMGELSNTDERTLAYWDADFTPRALTFDPADLDGGPCVPEIPAACMGPNMDPNDVRYVHVLSDVPLELDPGDPNRPRFAREVDFDLTPAPEGHLICSDIVTGDPAGVVRNEFEPGLGFDMDLAAVHLLPLDPNDPGVTDPNARYEASGEMHLPFYMATDAPTRVERAAASVSASFTDPDSKLSLSQSVLGGLFDIDIPLKYFPPDRDAGIPARFLGGKDLFDLKFIGLTSFAKILGKDPQAAGDLANREHPEMYLGFLSDMASYAEAKLPSSPCGAGCRGILEDLGSFGDVDPNGEIQRALPALEAGFARLQSEGIANFRSLVASEMQGAIGSSLPADIALAASRVSKAIDGVKEGFEAFKTLNMTGPGTFERTVDEALPDPNDAADWVLDQIDINADIDVVNFINFKGFVSYNRHRAEGHADVTIGARDVPLGWITDGARARLIEGTFTFQTDPSFQIDAFDAAVEVEDVKFGDVALDEVGLYLGMGNPPGAGNDFFYVAANARGRYKSVTGEAAFFLGTSRTIDPLVAIDEDVGEFLEGRTRMEGVYVRFGGSFPLFGGPDCAPFRLNVGGANAYWLFLDIPAFGTKMRAYAHGSLACVVTARADVTLLGGKTADVWQLAGHGFVAGGVGWCEPEEWDSRRDVLRDDWCLACVMTGEFQADSRHDGFHGDLHGPDCN